MRLLHRAQHQQKRGHVADERPRSSRQIASRIPARPIRRQSFSRRPFAEPTRFFFLFCVVAKTPSIGSAALGPARNVGYRRCPRGCSPPPCRAMEAGRRPRVARRKPRRKEDRETERRPRPPARIGGRCRCLGWPRPGAAGRKWGLQEQAAGQATAVTSMACVDTAGMGNHVPWPPAAA